MDQQQDLIIHIPLPKGMLGLHLISAHTAVQPQIENFNHFILGSYSFLIQLYLSVSAEPHVCETKKCEALFALLLDSSTE